MAVDWLWKDEQVEIVPVHEKLEGKDGVHREDSLRCLAENSWRLELIRSRMRLTQAGRVGRRDVLRFRTRVSA